MKCDICDKETNELVKFYWGFFKTEYEPEKWINACSECTLKFQKASNIYMRNRTPLIEMENKIKSKVRRR